MFVLKKHTTVIIAAKGQWLNIGYGVGYFHFSLQHSKRLAAFQEWSIRTTILLLLYIKLPMKIFGMSLWMMGGRWVSRP